MWLNFNNRNQSNNTILKIGGLTIIIFFYVIRKNAHKELFLLEWVMLFRAFFIKVWKEKQNGESHSTSAVTLTQSLPDLSTIILPNDIQDPNSKLINVCVDKVWVDIDADAVVVVGVGDWMEGGGKREEKFHALTKDLH